MSPIIKETRAYVKSLHDGETTGHDWFHIERVCKTALAIGTAENADLERVSLIALLHDVDDPKVAGPDSIRATEWLLNQGLPAGVVYAITAAIDQVSFSKGKPVTTLEAAVVQDADRLDALGAVGIARCFAFGGSKGKMIYNPSDLVGITVGGETHGDRKGSSIAHFYDKLLHLKDRMNTETGRKVAAGRHAYLEEFLNRFFSEWESMDVLMPTPAEPVKTQSCYPCGSPRR